VPEISRFLGIIIYMYGKDHPPPHFHFVYGDYEGVVYIESGVVEGKAPSKVIKRVTKWLELHKSELTECWELAQKGSSLFKIEPLS
jgi:hypothetical protein